MILNIDTSRPYTEEELQKHSQYPLFEDFYINENPENYDLYHYVKRGIDKSKFCALDLKYKKLLPEYFHMFDIELITDENGEFELSFLLEDEFINALKIYHGISRKISRSELTKIIQKDTKDLFKKLGRDHIVGPIQL